MRRNGKRDDNEPEIVAYLRAVGCLVQPLMQGGGVPDLIVVTPERKRMLLLEVKASTKVTLTIDQRAWHEEWQGAPVFVVASPDEALTVVAAADEVDALAATSRYAKAETLGGVVERTCLIKGCGSQTRTGSGFCSYHGPTTKGGAR